MERNYNIDVARFIFAFFVVIIHVPLIGADYLMPLARCAVPFFYMISGYFLFSNDDQILESRLISNMKKWWKMWLTYILILIVISLVLNKLLGNTIHFSKYEILFWLTNGVGPAVDIVVFRGVPYGLQTVWFLYVGAITFTIFYFFKRQLMTHSFFILILLLFIASVIVNIHFQTRVMPRLFTASFPSVYLGMLIKRHYEKIHRNIGSTTKLYATALVLLIISYSEYYLRGGGTVKCSLSHLS